MESLARLMQRQVPIGSKVTLSLKDGDEITGILVGIGRDHVTLEHDGNRATVSIETIGAWQVAKEDPCVHALDEPISVADGSPDPDPSGALVSGPQSLTPSQQEKEGIEEVASENQDRQPQAPQRAQEQLAAFNRRGGTWTKAVAKKTIPVYSSADTGSQQVATIEPNGVFQVGEAFEEGGKKWVTVRLPDGQRGFITGASQAISEQTMLSDINSWSWGLIVIGVIHWVLSGLLDWSWGILLVLAGISARFVKRRFMFIIFGVILLVAGLSNLLAGGAWKLFGFLQCYWGLQEFMKYSAYGVLDRPNAGEVKR